jgi:hypothetical protein
MTTKYARTVPKTLTPIPTPKSNIKVERISSGSKFSRKWPQSSVPGKNQAEQTTMIGNETDSASRPIKRLELFSLLFMGFN